MYQIDCEHSGPNFDREWVRPGRHLFHRPASTPPALAPTKWTPSLLFALDNGRLSTYTYGYSHPTIFDNLKGGSFHRLRACARARRASAVPQRKDESQSTILSFAHHQRAIPEQNVAKLGLILRFPRDFCRLRRVLLMEFASQAQPARRNPMGKHHLQESNGPRATAKLADQPAPRMFCSTSSKTSEQNRGQPQRIQIATAVARRPAPTTADTPKTDCPLRSGHDAFTSVRTFSMRASPATRQLSPS